MASSGKRKTTFAKLSRESKLREKRAIKEARKQERKQSHGEEPETVEPQEEEYFGRLAEDPTSV